MVKNRLLNVVLGAAVVLTAIFAIEVYQPGARAKEDGYPYTGMGEWRRFETRQDSHVAVAEGSASPSIGMGDLRLEEALRSHRSLDAETARWVAMGKYYLEKQAQESHRSHRSLDAETARWVAMGKYYLEKQAQESHRSHRSLEAESARWVAMGEYYTAKQETTSALASTHPSAGMGALRWIESQQSIPNKGAGKDGHTYAGTGDLRRFEAMQAIPDTVGPENSSSYTGRGDYQILEAQLLLLNSALKESIYPPEGMGDLRRLESVQGFEFADAAGSAAP
jgi:hypothetical protein